MMPEQTKMNYPMILFLENELRDYKYNFFDYWQINKWSRTCRMSLPCTLVFQGISGFIFKKPASYLTAK